MRSKLFKFCSIFLVFAILINMLPPHCLALGTQSGYAAETDAEEDAVIVEEITARRSAFSKQFQLSNGLCMAAVYPEAVHYQKDGKWEEIDNTLRSVASGTQAGYANTAGVWDITLPAQLSAGNAITVAKDGYTLRFGMDGALSAGSEALPASGMLSADAMMEAVETGTLTVERAAATSAQVQQIDLTEKKGEAAYAQTVVDTLNSRLRYADVYANTDIVYDLTSNKLKESVVLRQFERTLRGYRYTMDVGELVPVLGEDGHIDFYDEAQQEIIMVMPAPYLLDDAGVRCSDVTVLLQGSGSTYSLIYLLPQQWLAAQERAWPVILDPVISAEISTSNIRDQTVAENVQLDYEWGVLECGYSGDYGIHRFFIQYAQLPSLTSADAIVSASIELYKTHTTSTADAIEVHKVNNTWKSDTITWSNKPSYNPTVEDFAVVSSGGYYHWDVTDIVRGWYSGSNTGMMFKSPDSVETGTKDNFEQFYSSDYGLIYKPTLIINFRNNNGLESYWDYTVSSAGRAGTGYINNYTGNLVWTHDDIGFGGSRMPVSIRHVYNANDSTNNSTNNSFGMGYGWRTNFNQRVYRWSKNSNYYVWEDSDGTKHYFLHSSDGTYQDEDGLELTLTNTGSGASTYCIKDKYGNASFFDANGRLTKQQNNQQTKSSITVAYTTASGFLISSVTDGVGRTYSFTYADNLLSRISYRGTGSAELSYVAYAYNAAKLTAVTSKDGKSASYTYTANNLLSSAQDIDGYKLTYSYNTTAAGQPSRVSKVCEYSGSTAGGELHIEYAHNQTTFTDHNGNVQIHQFNNWGNTISVQDGQGRAQYARYAADTSASAKGNQLSLASKLQNTVGNVLKDSGFENGVLWTNANSSVTSAIASDHAYRGSKALKMVRASAGADSGVYSSAFLVESGATYTFSAYVKTGSGPAYLALSDGSTTVTGETLAANRDWTRLEVSYTNESASAKSVTARLMTNQAGTTYMDCAQVEKAPTASRYNLIENGDFRHANGASAYGWVNGSGCTASDTRVTADAAAPELDATVYRISGSPKGQKMVSQTVPVSGSAGDTFVLAGWAKGDAVPFSGFDSNPREFGIQAVFHYTDGTTSSNAEDDKKGVNIARFNPDADSSVNWQYSAAPIVAKKAYSSITVRLVYSYNANTVFFDGIQLYKEELGNSYAYDGDGNVTSVKDIQGQITTYEYTNNNLTKAILPTGAKLSYTYDNFHNVKTATTQEGVAYAFGYDAYGNNTSVSILSGGVSLTGKAAYSADGNRLVSTTDAAGKTTTYSYNADTNVLEWVRYPEDTAASATTYTYDNMYRVASASTVVGNETLSAVYTYSDDLLTGIQTGSTAYSFSYGDFALRSSVKIGSRTLASYSYTSRNNYLSSLDYGNGDGVDYTYDKQGRVIAQTYEDGSTVSYRYDNSGALATVTDSASGATTTYYYDFTDRLMKYVESSGADSHSVGYEYDSINNLTALVDTINGVTRKTTYAYDDDNRITDISSGASSRSYAYDAYSRISRRVTKNGSDTVLTDILSYRSPADALTTGQVATLKTDAAGYHVTYTYAYDDNGNIVSISDGTNTTTYVYDTANQLTRENNQSSGKTWVWVYDNAGNILSRREYAYTTGALGAVVDTVVYAYGNSEWGDLLTSFDGKPLTYDTIGNLTSDGTWQYTWRHGRQLASMYGEDTDGTDNEVTIAYTYNADNLRTGKTVTTKTYETVVTHIHSYTSTVVAPTCTEGGYTLHECACGDSYRDSETPALGHSYTSRVVESTCTGEGYTLYECTVCGYSYQDNQTPALGHSYTSTVVAPTCTEKGYTLHECTVCGYSYQDNQTPARGHRYVKTIVDPTCEEGGYTEHMCFACGYSYRSDEVPALGHDYELISETKTERKYRCIRCGEIYTKTIGVIDLPGPVNPPEPTEPTNPIDPPIPVKPPIEMESIGTGASPAAQTNGTDISERVLVSTVVEDYIYVYTGGKLMQMTVTMTTTTGDTTETASETLTFAYDASGIPMSLTDNGTVYYYACNIQGDVAAILDADGTAVVRYTYDAWGNILSTTGSMASTLGETNPLRYRGYAYDTETDLYYLQSRYYNPEMGRFLNADGLVSTGQDMTGYNMFAYCGNNPVNRKDSTGQFWIAALVAVVTAVCVLTLPGCSSQTASPRSDLAGAPDLDVNTAPPGTYNCYGNGIGKQIVTDPTGYVTGDSTRKTFEAVKSDLGSHNVRELTSINDPIGEDEFKVAMKCGPMDYHFIRLDGSGWYNKSGTTQGLYIDQSIVAKDIWYAMWINNGRAYIGNPLYGEPYYNDETIYFAVKIGWDAQ